MSVYIMTKPPEVHTLWHAVQYLQDSVGWPIYHHDPEIIAAIKVLREALGKVENE